MSVTPRLPAPSYLDYPFAIDSGGRAAQTLDDDHVRDMIEQVLFTAPGERVMLPDFGCGLLKQVFEPNSDLLAAATQLLVRASLHIYKFAPNRAHGDPECGKGGRPTEEAP